MQFCLWWMKLFVLDTSRDGTISFKLQLNEVVMANSWRIFSVNEYWLCTCDCQKWWRAEPNGLCFVLPAVSRSGRHVPLRRSASLPWRKWEPPTSASIHASTRPCGPKAWGTVLDAYSQHLNVSGSLLHVPLGAQLIRFLCSVREL